MCPSSTPSWRSSRRTWRPTSLRRTSPGSSARRWGLDMDSGIQGETLPGDGTVSYRGYDWCYELEPEACLEIFNALLDPYHPSHHGYGGYHAGILKRKKQRRVPSVTRGALPSQVRGSGLRPGWRSSGRKHQLVEAVQELLDQGGRGQQGVGLPLTDERCAGCCTRGRAAARVALGPLVGIALQGEAPLPVEGTDQLLEGLGVPVQPGPETWPWRGGGRRNSPGRRSTPRGRSRTRTWDRCSTPRRACRMDHHRWSL